MLMLLALSACDPNPQQGNHTTDASTDGPLWEAVYSPQKRSLGDSITIAAQQTLMANVKAAMKRGGPTEAVDFCNVHAMPLTDSLSAHYGVQISRISSQNRNPENAPADAIDKDMLALWAKQKENGEALATKMTLVKGQDEQLRFYKPIAIGMPTCLKCHGQPGTDIAPETLSMIRKRYPDGQATGYRQGDLRGSWKVVFEE